MLSRADHLLRNAAAASCGMPVLRLERLTYRFVAAGFVAL
jgi:hypothetical protein